MTEETAHSPGPAATGGVGYRELVAENRNFRFLWFGQIVSLLGDWFNLIASASLISTLTESGIAIGGLFAVRMLAPFLISPVAGVLADRFDRRRLLIATDLLRAAVVICFLLVREPQHVWLLYVLTALQLALSGIFFPTRNAILPDLVPTESLGAANALSSATWSVMLAIGAALGGIAAGQWGVYVAFVIDAATFLVSAVLLTQIRMTSTSDTAVAAPEGLGEAVALYLSGVRYLTERPAILVLALSKAAFALAVSGGFEVAQVAIARGVFVVGEGGSTSLGILYMISGIGTGLGPIIARRIVGDHVPRLGALLPIAFALGILGLLIIAPLTTFPLVIAGNAVRAIGSGTNWVMSTQLLLLLLPNEVRGRVFATEFALATLGAAGGAALAGVLLDSPGIEIGDLLRLQAGLLLIPGVLWLAWWLRSGRVGLERQAALAPASAAPAVPPRPPH